MRRSRLFVVLAAVVMAPAAGAQPLGLGALAGEPAAAVSAALGVAPGVAPDPDLGFAEGFYALPGGGTLSVVYCEGRAMSFDLRAARSYNSASALLAHAEIPLGLLEVSEEAPGHTEWTARDRPEGAQSVLPVRVLASTVDGDWVRLTADYTVPC